MKVRERERERERGREPKPKPGRRDLNRVKKRNRGNMLERNIKRGKLTKGKQI